MLDLASCLDRGTTEHFEQEVLPFLDHCAKEMGREQVDAVAEEARAIADWIASMAQHPIDHEKLAPRVAETLRRGRETQERTVYRDRCTAAVEMVTCEEFIEIQGDSAKMRTLLSAKAGQMEKVGFLPPKYEPELLDMIVSLVPRMEPEEFAVVAGSLDKIREFLKRVRRTKIELLAEAMRALMDGETHEQPGLLPQGFLAGDVSKRFAYRSPLFLTCQPAEDELRTRLVELFVGYYVGDMIALTLKGAGQRAEQIAQMALPLKPEGIASEFVARVSRCCLLGLTAECVAMCRAATEEALKSYVPLETLERWRESNESKGDLHDLLRAGLAQGMLSKDAFQSGNSVRIRGNKVLHDDPKTAEDLAVDTAKLALRVIQEIENRRASKDRR
jgi:hypothetical protein